MQAQKLSQGLLIKFQDENFGVIQIFGNKIFTGSSIEWEP